VSAAVAKDAQTSRRIISFLPKRAGGFSCFIKAQGITARFRNAKPDGSEVLAPRQAFSIKRFDMEHAGAGSIKKRLRTAAVGGASARSARRRERPALTPGPESPLMYSVL